MKLHAAIDDYESDLNLCIEGARLTAELEGGVYELGFQNTGDRRLLLMSEGEVFDCRIEGDVQSGAPVDVIVGTNCYSVELTDPKRLRSAAAAGMHAGGAARLVAPMPGKIVRVLTQVGAEVEAGDGLIVVEAMKMQNEMKSPKAGKITAINVEVGATVNGGDVLAVIE